MNKRAILAVASVLVVTSIGYGSATVQQSTRLPTAAPTLQVGQKPVSLPAPPAPPTPAQPGFTNPNVRVDVTITDQSGTGPAIKKTMTIVANSNGSLRSGVNVPIPTTYLGATLEKGATETRPIASYNYRTMGLSLDVSQVWVTTSTGLIHMRMSLEYNPVEESEKVAVSSAPVSYSNFSQTFTLDLENGKPIIAAVTSDPVPNRNRTLSVEVKATILK